MPPPALWSFSSCDSASESDFNELYEEGSESGFSTASSSQYQPIRTPPSIDQPNVLSDVAEGTELLPDDGGYSDSNGIDFSNWEDSLPSARLPHVPLRPFRNQVGGHSAIYKFTRRAVCKVNFSLLVSHVSRLIFPINSL